MSQHEEYTVCVVCVDEWTQRPGSRVWEKRWHELADQHVVLGEDQLDDYRHVSEPVVLLAVHSSAATAVRIASFATRLGGSSGSPYVLWVRSSGQAHSVSNDGLTCWSAVPVPSRANLTGQRTGFSRLVSDLGKIPAASVASADVALRTEAWQRWEAVAVPGYLTVPTTLHQLCAGAAGSLAAALWVEMLGASHDAVLARLEAESIDGTVPDAVTELLERVYRGDTLDGELTHLAGRELCRCYFPTPARGLGKC